MNNNIKQTSPYISVIIPVHNDSQRLQLCLAALENQSYPKYSYEVIVIDNNSTDNVKEIVITENGSAWQDILNLHLACYCFK